MTCVSIYTIYPFLFPFPFFCSDVLSSVQSAPDVFCSICTIRRDIHKPLLHFITLHCTQLNSTQLCFILFCSIILQNLYYFLFPSHQYVQFSYLPSVLFLPCLVPQSSRSVIAFQLFPLSFNNPFMTRPHQTSPSLLISTRWADTHHLSGVRQFYLLKKHHPSSKTMRYLVTNTSVCKCFAEKRNCTMYSLCAVHVAGHLVIFLPCIFSHLCFFCLHRIPPPYMYFIHLSWPLIHL